ncbi:hypothetical protein D3C79_757410 [compost metagenome]
MQRGQSRRRILHLRKLRNVCLSGALILHGHIHGQLVSRLQGLLRITQVAFASMRGVVPLNTQEIELVNQRLAYTVDKDRILNQLVKGGLRHTGQCFMLIDSLGHLFGKATKSRERTARVDVKYGLRQAREICQQLVARPEEFEID